MTVLDQETVKWYSADAPPDDETTVLVYVPGADEPVWLAYYDDGTWLDVSGFELVKQPTAWAPMPAGAVCAEAPVWP